MLSRVLFIHSFIHSINKCMEPMSVYVLCWAGHEATEITQNRHGPPLGSPFDWPFSSVWYNEDEITGFKVLAPSREN